MWSPKGWALRAHGQRMILRAISKAADLIQGKSSKRIQEFSCVPERTNAKNRGWRPSPACCARHHCYCEAIPMVEAQSVGRATQARQRHSLSEQTESREGGR